MSNAEKIKAKMASKNKKPSAHESLMGGNPNINNNINNNINKSVTIDEKYKQRKKRGKTSNDLVGIYFDSDVKAMLETKSKEFGRGYKSEFVNDLVRKEMIRRGWME